jgi:hypothetical protein
MSNVKFILNASDSDGSFEHHGVFDTREEARLKLKKCIEDMKKLTCSETIEEFSDWHNLKEDSFSWGVDRYRYYIGIAEVSNSAK